VSAYAEKHLRATLRYGDSPIAHANTNSETLEEALAKLRTSLAPGGVRTWTSWTWSCGPATVASRALDLARNGGARPWQGSPPRRIIRILREAGIRWKRPTPEGCDLAARHEHAGYAANGVSPVVGA